MKLLLQDGCFVEIINNTDRQVGQAFSEGDDINLPTKEALSRVTQFANEAMEQFRNIGNPDEVEIEFGIEAGGEGGFFGLAKVHSKATITIKAKWAQN